MTLPPRLPVPPASVDLDAADSIVARARRRRRSQLGGAAGLVAASLVAITAVGPSAGTAGLDPVDPTVRASDAPGGGDAGGGADPRLVPARPGAASPDTTGARPPAGQPGQAGSGSATGNTAAEGRRSRREPRASVTREVVTNRVAEPCQQTFTHVLRGTPADAAHMCLRYSWPLEVRAGEQVPFFVEYCALDRDVPARWAPRPSIRVGSATYDWGLYPGTPRQETLHINTCWRWSVRWNGVGHRIDSERVAAFPPGTYSVDVGQPNADRFSVYSTHSAPNRPTTLTIRR